MNTLFLLGEAVPTVDMTATLQTLVDGAVTNANKAAPIVLGGCAVFVGLKLVIKIFKNFSSKVG